MYTMHSDAAGFSYLYCGFTWR